MLTFLLATYSHTLDDESSIGHGLVALQGTSMATPVAAGVAALVRQYFVDGYYPTGKVVWLEVIMLWCSFLIISIGS